MSSDDRTSTLRVFAVSVGAVCLVAPVAFFVLVDGVETLVGWFGVGPVTGAGGAALRVVAGLLALSTASIAVDSQFEPVDALGGDGGWRVVRPGTVWTVVLAAVVVMLDFAMNTVVLYPGSPLLPREALVVTVFLFALVGAVLWAMVAFWDGFTTAR